jgi:hypothetical protein
VLIEYIKKGSKKSKKKIHLKRGVMLSYAAEGKVLIGFSLCHSKFDRFDFIKEMRVPHHGFKIALERATKWEDQERFIIKGTSGTISNHVVVPQSIQKNLHKFITRTIQYYRDKKIPSWALGFKDYMDRLDQIRHKPIIEEKGVREVDCCS